MGLENFALYKAHQKTLGTQSCGQCQLGVMCVCGQISGGETEVRQKKGKENKRKSAGTERRILSGILRARKEC